MKEAKEDLHGEYKIHDLVITDKQFGELHHHVMDGVRIALFDILEKEKSFNNAYKDIWQETFNMIKLYLKD